MLHVLPAARSIRRRPGMAAAVVVTLALGTAAVTTVFSLVDTVLLKPLPYPDADRLVTVYEASATAGAGTSLVAPARLADWNRLNRSFTAISALYSESVTDTSGAEPERLDGRRVAPGYFTVFGVDALVGRTFSPEEELFGGPGAAVLSESFWRRRFGGSPEALGRALLIGDRPHAIVGVMPASFAPPGIDVWLPAQLAPGLMQVREARFLNGIGRLRRGVTIEQARADLARVQQELAAAYPATDTGWSAAVSDLKDARVGDHRTRLWLAFGAVGLLWLIAVANAASLVLVDTGRRALELAVRVALGASQGRIAGIVLQQVLLLAVIGGVLGAVLSVWLLQYLGSAIETLPRAAELAVDWRALTFAAATSLTAALVCGLTPALSSTRRPLLQTMSQRGRGSSARTHRLQRSLVIAQVALSVLLSASAALLARTYYNLTHADLGLSADGVLVFRVAARWDEDRTRVGQLQQGILDGLADMDVVDAAGLTNFLPVAGRSFPQAVAIEGLSPSDGPDALTASQRFVTAGYFRALQVPLLAGEWCAAPGTAAGTIRTAMVNRRFAAHLTDPTAVVGRRLTFAQFPEQHTVVGVVADLAEDGPAVDVAPYVYVCAQPGHWPDPEYVVRVANAAAFTPALRGLVRRLDPTRAIFGLRSLDDVLAASVDQPRTSASLASALAGVAVFLSATGLYSLFMLMVGESRRELGVRLALGAAPRQLVHLVFAKAGRLLGLGVLVGLVLTIAAGQWLQSFLFGVSALDVTTLVAATCALLLVSVLAIAIPAVRAARVAPSEALVAE